MLKTERKPEPKLCPDCPLRAFIDQVKSQSWNNQPTKDSSLTLCARLRELSRKWGWVKCPHYPENERIDRYAER